MVPLSVAVIASILTWVTGVGALFPGVDHADCQPPKRSVIGYEAEPAVFTLAEYLPTTLSGAVSDIEIVDLDGIGPPEIAVAWYLTDADRFASKRRLTILALDSTGAVYVAAERDLYYPDPFLEQLSVFRNGTGELAVGDFDGDGDQDLAALPFYGDEMWFFENLGGGTLAQFVKYPFNINTTGNFITPPRALAGDFDGNGRDELVYIVDPTLYVDARVLHFWYTSSTISAIHRGDWQTNDPITNLSFTRAMTVADFDADGRDDLCFSGLIYQPPEATPVLSIWHNYNPGPKRFDGVEVYPSFEVADLTTVTDSGSCRADLMLSDSEGCQIEYWRQACSDPPTFQWLAGESGYSSFSPGFGMSIEPVDMDGDGDPDLLSRQKLIEPDDTNAIELTTNADGDGIWQRSSVSPFDSSGFQTTGDNEILRPRNLAACDLLGNRLPEVIAAYERRIGEAGEPDTIAIAIWLPHCVGDVTRDGLTDLLDLSSLLVDFGDCGASIEHPDADLNKDGCIDALDLSLLLVDLGCK